MTALEAPADTSWVTFDEIGVKLPGWLTRRRVELELTKADPALVGCSCCSAAAPCRSLRRMQAKIVAENARKDALLALRGEDVEWLLANGWDGR